MTSDSTLPGVNVLLMGPTGTGKTHSIGTLVDAGLQVRYFAFEAGAESLIGYWRDKGKEVPPNLSIFTVRAASASWGEMADAAKQVNQLSYDALKKALDFNRSKYDQYEKFLRTFVKPISDDGEEFPPVDSWGTDTALVIDGMTGMGDAAMKAVIGGKFDKDQKDWGLAQNMVENTTRRLCDGCRCHFVLLSHVEKEADPLGGSSKITVSTLGAKLAPKIPAMFSDVILTKRIGRDFYWDTEDAMADLKTRNLPIAAKLPPTFAAILDRWKGRGGK
jgi:hypothetical protein